MNLPDWLKRPHHEEGAQDSHSLDVVLLSAVLVVTVYLVIGDIAFHRTIGPLASPRRADDMLSPAVPPTVDEVAGWMTFEYLDRVFDLPPDALKRSLEIDDMRYPRLSIRRWAAASGQDSATALERVKQAIRAAQPK